MRGVQIDFTTRTNTPTVYEFHRVYSVLPSVGVNSIIDRILYARTLDICRDEYDTLWRLGSLNILKMALLRTKSKYIVCVLRCFRKEVMKSDWWRRYVRPWLSPDEFSWKSKFGVSIKTYPNIPIWAKVRQKLQTFLMVPYVHLCGSRQLCVTYERKPKIQVTTNMSPFTRQAEKTG